MKEAALLENGDSLKFAGIVERMAREVSSGEGSGKFKFEGRFLNAYLRCFRGDVERCLKKVRMGKHRKGIANKDLAFESL